MAETRVPYITQTTPLVVYAGEQVATIEEPYETVVDPEILTYCRLVEKGELDAESAAAALSSDLKLRAMQILAGWVLASQES